MYDILQRDLINHLDGVSRHDEPYLRAHALCPDQVHEAALPRIVRGGIWLVVSNDDRHTLVSGCGELLIRPLPDRLDKLPTTAGTYLIEVQLMPVPVCHHLNPG